jgi:indolepyruvate ferredoxin oxidoreductase alpha subunit
MELKELLTGKQGDKLFLLGNEAAVRGAIESGVFVATTYPGTPSSEIGDIFHYLAKDANIYFEFSINEKVAMEVAASSAVSGLRSFTFMKHVGLNVASDSFISTAYTGVNGGMLILTADDPSMFSSQNEQDNRHYARLAKLPILEPSNPQELKDMMIYGFEISQKFKIPVIIRTTTRISHMRGIVELGEINPTIANDELDIEFKKNNIGSIKNSTNLVENNSEFKDNNLKDSNNLVKKGFFKKNPNQYVPVPANAAVMHRDLVLKLENIKKIVDVSKLNFVYKSNTCNNFKDDLSNKFKFGIISCGSSFNYVYDIVNKYNLNMDILKLGFTYPFPEKPVLDFINDLDGVFIVEEVDPIMEKEILAIIGRNHLKTFVFGKLNHVFPLIYEFTPDIILESFKNFYNFYKNFYKINNNFNYDEKSLKLIADEFYKKSINTSLNNKVDLSEEIKNLIEKLPNRPPTLCAGCPHRSIYYAVKKAYNELEIPEDQIIYSSDIGCYTLGISPPYQTADYLLSMGSSIGNGGGFSKATNQHVMSFIGDSTFFHSGVAPLINGIHNKNNFVLTVLDNRTTAMTGGQPNPGIEVDGMGDIAPIISIEKIAIATGAEFVKVINPLNLKNTVKIYKEAINFKGLSVIISKSPCTLIKGLKKKKSMKIDYNKCINCLDCIKNLACPAITFIDDKVVIDDLSCKGCTTCIQICKERAIKISKKV